MFRVHSTAIRRVLTIVSLAATMVVAGYSSMALADHWHTFNNHTHGLEHGSSTTDGYFFGRTYGYYFGDTNYCGVGDWDVGVNYYGYSSNSSLCSVWTGAYYSGINECHGASYNAVTNPNSVPQLSAHNHYRHNPTPASCHVNIT